MESESVCSDEEEEGEDDKLVSTKEAAQYFKKSLPWMESQNDVDAVQFNNAAKTHDGLRNAINLQVFVTNKNA